MPRHERAAPSRWPAWATSAVASVVVLLAVVSGSPGLRASFGRATGALKAHWSSESTAVAASEPVPAPVATAPPQRRAPRRAARPNAPAPASEARGTGLLSVSSRIPVDVYLRGHRIGSSDGQIVLAGGSHVVDLVNQRFNYRAQASVTISAGAITSHTVSLPSGLVRVETAPGAEVWIEGERIGEAPLDDVPIPIGTREVLVRSVDRRERRFPVEVREGQVAIVNAPFETPDAAAAAAALPALTAPKLQIIR